MFKKLLKTEKAKGFTIIEVMIVLAIAGLIMVVVLIAVPQLQRNQRDSNRQNVTARLSTEFGNYASNNNGALPFATGATGLADFNTRYVVGKVDLKNPETGNDYAFVLATTQAQAPTADQILIYPTGTCSGESVTATTITNNTSRQYALRILLEGGGRFYCVDNN